MTTKKTLYLKAYIIDEEGRVMAQKKPGGIPVQHASIGDVDCLAISTLSDQPEHDLMVKASANLAALLLLSKRSAVSNTEAMKKIVKLAELSTEMLDKASQ